MKGPKGDRWDQGVQGPTGADAKQTELSASGWWLSWRRVGDTNWNPMIDLMTLRWPAGPQGVQGERWPVWPTGPKGDALRSSYLPESILTYKERPKYKQLVWAGTDIPYEATFAKWINPDIIDLLFTFQAPVSDYDFEQMHLCSMSFKGIWWNGHPEINILTDSSRLYVSGQGLSFDDNTINSIPLVNDFFTMSVYVDIKHKVLLIHANWKLLYSAKDSSNWRTTAFDVFSECTVRVWWPSISTTSFPSKPFNWRVFGISLNHHRKTLEQLAKNSKAVVPFDYNYHIDTITEQYEDSSFSPKPIKNYLTSDRVGKAIAGSIKSDVFHQIWESVNFWWTWTPRTVSWLYRHSASLWASSIIQIGDWAFTSEYSYDYLYRVDVFSDWTVNMIREADGNTTQIWMLLLWYNIMSISYKPGILCLYINWKVVRRQDNPESGFIHPTNRLNVLRSPYFLFTCKETAFQEEIGYKDSSKYYKYVNWLTWDIIS